MRVLLIDDGFTGLNGHNAAYNFSICKELKNREIESSVFANRQTKQLSELPANVLPIFRYNAASFAQCNLLLPRRLSGAFKLLLANANHFWDLLWRVTGQVQPDDIILNCLQTPYTTFAMALWLFWLGIIQKRVTVISVIHTMFSRTLRSELFVLKSLQGVHRITYATQNEFLRAYSEQQTKLRFVTLPLPYLRTIEGQSKASSTSPIHFVYLGIASASKGLDLLIEAIPELHELLEQNQIQFTIQFSLRTTESSEHYPFQQKLIQLTKQYPGVKVIFDAMSQIAYEETLLQADVVLSLNRASAYPYARSGVFSEALACAKPVIVATGTVMADEIARFDSGLIFEDGSSQSLVKIIRQAVRVYPMLCEKAISAQIGWIAFHNARNYVDILLREHQNIYGNK